MGSRLWAAAGNSRSAPGASTTRWRSPSVTPVPASRPRWASASSSSSSPQSLRARGWDSISRGRSSKSSTAARSHGRARLDRGPLSRLRCRSRGHRMSDERMADQAMLLVADDDPAVRQSLERTLTREGYGVVLAPDGQARLDDLLREGNAIGVSYAFKQMMTLVGQVADSSASVLIQGESGTGKELAARAIHDRSPRRQGPFVAVNCAALPETLLESELFGYEKGAFTGAGNRKEGRFELADGGTLFLDEVADLSPVTQPKILRVLQEGEFERVGGTRTLRVDVRIVTATNQDLTQLVRDKRFREELFYRLNVITITTPPLRDRREDIPVLAQHFLRLYAAKNNRKLDGVSDGAMGCLEAYAWPGNVRELENVIERAVVLARGTAIEVENLPANVTERSVMFKRDELESGPGVSGDTPGGVFTIRVGTPLAEVEQRLLEEPLRMNKGNRSLTAMQLGLDPKTVFRNLTQAEAESEEIAADAD